MTNCIRNKESLDRFSGEIDSRPSSSATIEAPEFRFLYPMLVFAITEIREGPITVVRSIVEPFATLMASDNFLVVDEIDEMAAEMLRVSGAVAGAEPAEVELRREVGEAMAIVSLDEVRQQSALN